MPKPTDLARASYRLKHSLWRRAAGEHSVPTEQLTTAFATEWRLNTAQTTMLRARAMVWEKALAAGKKTA